MARECEWNRMCNLSMKWCVSHNAHTQTYTTSSRDCCRVSVISVILIMQVVFIEDAKPMRSLGTQLMSAETVVFCRDASHTVATRLILSYQDIRFQRNSD